MSTITASAPGKLMLFGDHAVIYGYPCLVTAVDLRMRATVTLLNTPQVIFQVEPSAEPLTMSVTALQNQAELPQAIKFVGLAIRRFWQETGRSFGLSIETQGEFTYNYGLGSSSAVTVATMQALATATAITMSHDDLFRLSYDTVLEAQSGRASGFDVASATYGGTLAYTIGQPVEPLALEQLPLLVGYSGIKAGTVNLVAQVGALRTRYPSHVDPLFKAIGGLVEAARSAMEQGDYETVGQLMRFHQAYLQALGVTTSRLNRLIEGVQELGAWGAKLSGAGGGDCFIAVADAARHEAIRQFLRDAPFAGVAHLAVQTHAEGVRVE